MTYGTSNATLKCSSCEEQIKYKWPGHDDIDGIMRTLFCNKYHRTYCMFFTCTYCKSHMMLHSTIESNIGSYAICNTCNRTTKVYKKPKVVAKPTLKSKFCDFMKFTTNNKFQLPREICPDCNTETIWAMSDKISYAVACIICNKKYVVKSKG